MNSRNRPCLKSNFFRVWIFLIGLVYLGIPAQSAPINSLEDVVVVSKEGKPITFKEIRTSWTRWGASPGVWLELRKSSSPVVIAFLKDLALGSIHSELNGKAYVDGLGAIQTLGTKRNKESVEALIQITNHVYQYPAAETGLELNALAARYLLDQSGVHRTHAYKTLDDAANRGVVVCPFGYREQSHGQISRESRETLRRWFSHPSDRVKLKAAACMAEIGLDDPSVLDYVRPK
jgi:hypothetical protein